MGTVRLGAARLFVHAPVEFDKPTHPARLRWREVNARIETAVAWLTHLILCVVSARYANILPPRVQRPHIRWRAWQLGDVDPRVLVDETIGFVSILLEPALALAL